jgi:hypothetical protein
MRKKTLSLKKGKENQNNFLGFWNKKPIKEISGSNCKKANIKKIIWPIFTRPFRNLKSLESNKGTWS